MKKIEKFLLSFLIAAIVIAALSIVFVNPNKNEVAFELDNGHIVYFAKLNDELFEIRDNFSGMEYGQRFSRAQMDEMRQQFGWQQIRPVPNPTSNSSFFFSTAYAAEKKTIELFIGKTEHNVNGVSVKTDAAPFIEQGRTMVPLRFVAEAFGFVVDWYSDKRQILLTYVSTGDKVLLTINSHEVVVNGVGDKIDVPPQIVSGRTFVPIRFVVENIGARIADVQQHYHPTLGYPMGVSKVTIEMLY